MWRALRRVGTAPTRANHETSSQRDSRCEKRVSTSISRARLLSREPRTSRRPLAGRTRADRLAGEGRGSGLGEGCGVAGQPPLTSTSTIPSPPPSIYHIMRLVVATEEGDTFNLDVSNDIELENLQALLEAEVGPLRTSNISEETTPCPRTELSWLVRPEGNTQKESQLTQLDDLCRAVFLASRRRYSSLAGR